MSFADLFAEDGVLGYPFALPGQPRELHGRDAIRGYFGGAPASRRLFQMDGVEALVRQTDDPEVVVAEIEHHGRSLPWSPGGRTGSGRWASSASGTADRVL